MRPRIKTLLLHRPVLPARLTGFVNELRASAVAWTIHKLLLSDEFTVEFKLLWVELAVYPGLRSNRRPAFNGAGDKTRTYDLMITNQLLYQLSYTGDWVRGLEGADRKRKY